MFNKPQEIKSENSIYVFIDASNVWNAVKSVKKFIEYKTLKDYFDLIAINELWGKDLKYRGKMSINESHPQLRGWPWDV